MKQITLKTLPDSSLQEIFDYISNHLLTQGEKATVPGTFSCKYKIVIEGKILKCAAGYLFTDKEYSLFGEYMEGKQFTKRTLFIVGIYDYWELPTDREIPHVDLNIKFVERLQDLHDFTDPPKWHSELKRIAIEYNLNF